MWLMYHVFFHNLTIYSIGKWSAYMNWWTMNLSFHSEWSVSVCINLIGNLLKNVQRYVSSSPKKILSALWKWLQIAMSLFIHPWSFCCCCCCCLFVCLFVCCLLFVFHLEPFQKLCDKSLAITAYQIHNQLYFYEAASILYKMIHFLLSHPDYELDPWISTFWAVPVNVTFLLFPWLFIRTCNSPF